MYKRQAGHTPLHRMPAHAKLVGLLTFVLAVVSLPRGAHWPLLGMLAVAVGVLASTRVPFSLLLPRMVVEVPFVVFALAVSYTHLTLPTSDLV